jgi:hypothetical protein
MDLQNTVNTAYCFKVPSPYYCYVNLLTQSPPDILE